MGTKKYKAAALKTAALSFFLHTNPVFATPHIRYNIESLNGLSIEECRSKAIKSLDLVVGNRKESSGSSNEDNYEDHRYITIYGHAERKLTVGIRCQSFGDNTTLYFVFTAGGDSDLGDSIYDRLNQAMQLYLSSSKP